MGIDTCVMKPNTMLCIKQLSFEYGDDVVLHGMRSVNCANATVFIITLTTTIHQNLHLSAA